MSRLSTQRAVGPAGTTIRLAAGLFLIVVPITSRGLSAWDAAGALVILPASSLALSWLLTAFVTKIAGPRDRSSSHATWAINVGALILIIGIGTGLTLISPIDAGAIWLFFGVSLLVVALRGDAGCEALGISNALLGRRDRTGCIAFAPLDSLEMRRIAGRIGSPVSNPSAPGSRLAPLRPASPRGRPGYH